MDSLEGVLLVPPDRNHILGRPAWKARHVVIGRRTATKKDRQNSANSHGARSNTSDPKPLTKVFTDEYCISVFKSKGDAEPIHQWPSSCVSDCQVQMLAYRKQGPVLPTLVVTISDNQRKRRSSRAAGLISNKESGGTNLWFRTPPDDHHPSLHEWAQFIMSKKNPMTADGLGAPLSSPFSPRTREVPDYFPRPGSGNHNRSDIRPLQHKSSSATYSTGTRERPATFSSGSPSLRSKRSDISSPSSVNQHPNQKMAYVVAGQHYTTVLPTDAVSPGVRQGAYQGEFIEGWTTAQGRSPTVSSPTRGRDSMNSPLQHPMALDLDVSAPPAPGETILDRAFQLGHIPGAESNIPGQEKFSSIARFDALMRNMDEKRKQTEVAGRVGRAGMRGTLEADNSWDEPKSKDSESDSDSDDSHSADEQDDGYGKGGTAISPSAQRALAYIAGRHGEPSRDHHGSHRPTISRTHLSFHADPMPPPPQSHPSRPHTSHAKNRPSASYRTPSTQSTPHLAPPPPSNKTVEEGAVRRAHGEQRQSVSTTKRLSFSEFTKRLSSTSSLLLVQTNATGGSGRRSVEIDNQPSTARRTNVSHRGTVPPPRSQEWEEQDRKCGWRGSVGMVGSEGGFL